MPRHISILFPGQGSQHLGMLDNLPVELVESYRELALKKLDFDLVEIINKGPEELLNKTSITQPAILFTSYIYYKHILKITNLKPKLMCGHSLGEYSALVNSNSISFEDALNIVHQRGLIMEKSIKGSMYAILNTDIDIIDEVCKKVSKDENMIVNPANINSPKQIVIAGENKAVEIVINNLKERGYKKCIKLNVSVASHCKLMDEPSYDFKKLLDTIKISQPETRIIHNISASEAQDIDDLKENLIQHLTKPVLWSKTMNYIQSFDGIVIECGPGKVLTGLAKSNGVKNIYTSSSENFFDDIKSAL